MVARLLAVSPSGQMVTRRFPKDGSGIFTSVVASDGLIELHEEVETVNPGDVVPFIHLTDLMG